MSGTSASGDASKEMIAGHEVHPAASVFPMMTGDESRRLAEDMRRNGQRHAILRDASGRIFDGRNRLATAADAGVEPAFETVDLDDDEIFERVVSENIHRRHLTDAQRAVVGARLVMALRARGTPTGRASERVGTQLGLSARTIDEALAVLTRGVAGLPELVASGAIGVSVAATVARTKRATQEAAVIDGPGAVRALAKHLRTTRADLRAVTSGEDGEHSSAREGRDRSVSPDAEGRGDETATNERSVAVASVASPPPTDEHNDEAPATLDLDDAVARPGCHLDRHQSGYAGARVVLELDEATYQRWSRRLRRQDLAAAAFMLLEQSYEAAGG